VAESLGEDGEEGELMVVVTLRNVIVQSWDFANVESRQ
jgi:hypothetical protein